MRALLPFAVRPALAVLLLLSVPGLAAAQTQQPVFVLGGEAERAETEETAKPAKPAVPLIPAERLETRITKETRMTLIRHLNAENVFARRAFPMGQRGLVLDPRGQMEPDDYTLEQWIMQEGPAVRPGDRARITNVIFRGRSMVFEINGGPRKKKRWYERIEVTGMGGTATPGDMNQDHRNPRGSFVAILFDRHIPDLTVEEVKELLAPVFDFRARSVEEAYLDTVPENVREAIKNHEVLVGMNREMVTYAKGRPPRRIREREDGVEYEEWIYGQPPQDVEFVRFLGDEVVRVTIMPVTGERIVKTEKEVDATQYATGRPYPLPGERQEGEDPAEPPKRPTLRRPGEAPGQDDPRPADPVRQGPYEEPEWGKPAPTPPGTPSEPPDDDEPEL